MITKINLQHEGFKTTYPRNKGQQWEQMVRWLATGQIVKADNNPHYLGGDLYDIQIKTARATVCTYGDTVESLEKYLQADGAKQYLYVEYNTGNTGYLMDKETYKEMVIEFMVSSTDSKTGKAKIRLPRQKEKGKDITMWLEKRVGI